MKAQFAKFKQWMLFNRPAYASIDSWDDWDNDFKNQAPCRYFITQAIPGWWNTMVSPITHRFTQAKDWIRFRTYDRYHVVNTGLEPGYYDRSELMLHVNFNILVEYVEVELAWMNYICGDTKMPWWKEKCFSSRELGEQHLEWEKGLDDPALPVGDRNPTQAHNAREKHELYLWWKDVRPNRQEIQYNVRSSFDRAMVEKYGEFYIFTEGFMRDHPDAVKRRRQHAIDAAAQETTWKQEDEEMLVRLMKIRESLWT